MTWTAGKNPPSGERRFLRLERERSLDRAPIYIYISTSTSISIHIYIYIYTYITWIGGRDSPSGEGGLLRLKRQLRIQS